MNYVLSLNLGMSADAQALITLLHDCIERSNLDMLPGGAVICNCKSSVIE